ncbi:hypothetical protein C1645_816136 [Glomus cerebriforme]|uniref:Uncharacterized protein n=1 Tax=Glomus cerebriforme TaxID=658196 RepID=A0A397TC48_9GLOM|nr:hypothetical protein C1645_816136 [Glomus cerebriforme]
MVFQIQLPIEVETETIKHEIINKLDLGCHSSSPNIVILKLGSNSNSDDEILHVAEMYKKDFAMNSHSFLNIVADEAIFRRLIKYREKWPSIRPLLDSLFATGPFYASAAKSNYTMAIAHFLVTIAAHTQLEEKLCYCGAFKIPYDTDNDPENVCYVCFGFNEALESFGVRFIKGNISGNIIDEKNLKIQIKASQSERERIDLLMNEYLNDNLILHSEKTIKSHQESFLERIKGIYQQEVLKIESKITKGKRVMGVVRIKVKDYNNQKKLKYQSITDSSQSLQKNTNENLNEQSTDYLSDTVKPQPKQKKH